MLKVKKNWNIFLFIILIPLYMCAIEKYGLKISAFLTLSLFCGVLCKLISNKLNLASNRFPWPIFLAFPLILPIGIPVWMTAMGASFSILVGVWAFGGYGKHLFNPIALGLVFLIISFSSQANFSFSKPFDKTISGFKYWSSGFSIGNNSNKFFIENQAYLDLNKAVSGSIPSVPGAAYPILVIAIGMIVSLFSGANIIWFISTLLGVYFAATYGAPYFSETILSAKFQFLTGCSMLCLLISVIDFSSLPQTKPGLVVGGLLFGCALVTLRSWSSQPLAPFFALLLVQIILPLFEEIFAKPKVEPL